MLLQVEIGTGKSIENYFGGGYELILLERSRFLLLDDLLYAFWYANLEADRVSARPVLKFFKQNYYGDTLVVRTLEFQPQELKDSKLFSHREEEVHFLPPIYRELTAKEMSSLPRPDLKAFMLCTYVLVKSQKGIEVLNIFDWSKRREVPVRFVDDGSKITLEFQGAYLERIFAAIESRRG